MRKLLLTLGIILLLAWSLAPLSTRAEASDQEFETALTWMYQEGMTKYSTTDEYGPGLWLTREQGAKFFTVFMEQILDKHLERAAKENCTFHDNDMFDSTLTDYIARSCVLGLFKGTQGNFFAQEPLTKAQAITVLIRALEDMQDEDASPWWVNYYRRASLLHLTKETDVRSLDRPITRYEMALLLYRAVHDTYDPDEADITELEQLLLGLGLKRS